MGLYITWLTKLVLAHLLTDFVLQPSSWIRSRNSRHFSSPHLYLHGIVTAAVALLLIGYIYWKAVLAILATHILIDGWKSYQEDKPKYFLIDQALQLFGMPLAVFADIRIVRPASQVDDYFELLFSFA